MRSAWRVIEMDKVRFPGAFHLVFARTNTIRVEYVDYTWIRVTIGTLIALILVLVVVAGILWK